MVPSGKELFYLAQGLIAAETKIHGDAIEIGECRPLFRAAAAAYSPYDVSGDGQRFLFAVRAASPSTNLWPLWRTCPD